MTMVSKIAFSASYSGQLSLGKTEVSDIIISFNSVLGLGLGKFGGIYQLEGKPGGDRKVNNVLRKMLRAMPGSEYRDLTKECKKAMARAAVLAQKKREKSILPRTSLEDILTPVIEGYLKHLVRHVEVPNQTQSIAAEFELLKHKQEISTL